MDKCLDQNVSKLKAMSAPVYVLAQLVPGYPPAKCWSNLGSAYTVKCIFGLIWEILFDDNIVELQI